jgi:hypothetical protein
VPKTPCLNRKIRVQVQGASLLAASECDFVFRELIGDRLIHLMDLSFME